MAITPDNYKEAAPRADVERECREARERAGFESVTPKAMAFLEGWFRSRFGVDGCCFRKDANGRYESIDAVRRDAQREVWLRFVREWSEVHLTD